MLKTTALFFKEHYKGLTPEAVAAFVLICMEEKPTIVSLGRDLRFGGGVLIDHLNMLMGGKGAGLIGIQSMTDGSQIVKLTPNGREARARLLVEYEKAE